MIACREVSRMIAKGHEEILWVMVLKNSYTTLCVYVCVYKQ